MSWTASTKVALRAFPIGWLHIIASGAITESFRFDNLVSASLKIPKEASSSTNKEYTEVTRGDGAIIKFPKYNLSLSGEDGSDITEATASSDATGLGEITIVTNEADIGSATWTAFLKKLRDNKDALFMVTTGTGVTQSAQSRPDGYAIMIGKLTSDIEAQLSTSPTTISMTFASYKNAGLEVGDLTSTSLYTAIDWKLGGTGKDITGLKPATLTGTVWVSSETPGTGDIADITSGKIALIPVTA